MNKVIMFIVYTKIDNWQLKTLLTKNRILKAMQLGLIKVQIVVFVTTLNQQ